MPSRNNCVPRRSTPSVMGLINRLYKRGGSRSASSGALEARISRRASQSQ